MTLASLLCSICVRRRATRWDEIDGKRRPCCRPCLEGAVSEPARSEDYESATSSVRVLRAIYWQPGITVEELRLLLGIGDSVTDKHAYDRLTRTIQNLDKSGRLSVGAAINEYGMPVRAYSIATGISRADIETASRKGPRRAAA